jgi:hypothetical protein
MTIRDQNALSFDKTHVFSTAQDSIYITTLPVCIYTPETVLLSPLYYQLSPFHKQRLGLWHLTANLRVLPPSQYMRNKTDFHETLNIIPLQLTPHLDVYFKFIDIIKENIVAIQSHWHY